VSIASREIETDELLGGLNNVERKFAPNRLFLAGRIEIAHRSPRIAVIGSRRATGRGLQASERISKLIVEMGGVVVSGLAMGIDSTAHMTAMRENGATIAVLGTPLDTSATRINAELQARMCEEQLVVSQFEPGSAVQRGNFVIRNRTMALIAQASIIVEAGESSGTRHQGWEAIRLGRKVLLPRLLFDAGFGWPKEMLRYGAVVFNTPSELRGIIEEELPAIADARAMDATPF
jgi:DNA processing protein